MKQSTQLLLIVVLRLESVQMCCAKPCTLAFKGAQLARSSKKIHYSINHLRVGNSFILRSQASF